MALCAMVFLGTGCVQAQKTNQQPVSIAPKTKDMSMSIHKFSVEDLSGQPFEFSRLKGKKILVVNTASECGYTPQYKQLEELYKKYEGKVVVVGFPTNDFGGQEPGSNTDIAKFCEKNYGVTFPMMSKITVKGKAMHPIYQFLTQKTKNHVQDSEVEWNFQKYLINEDGELEKVVASKVSPMDEEIISWVAGK